MQAFHNTEAVKSYYIHRLSDHIEKRELVQGSISWLGKCGSAVGCTIHSNDTSDFERYLGIPTVLACAQEHLFDALPLKVAINYPVSFLMAIPVGADLLPVWRQFSSWILRDPLKQAALKTRTGSVKILLDRALTQAQSTDSSQETWAALCTDAEKIAETTYCSQSRGVAETIGQIAYSLATSAQVLPNSYVVRQVVLSAAAVVARTAKSPEHVRALRQDALVEQAEQLLLMLRATAPAAS